MQTRVLSVWRIFKCRYVLVTGHDHDILKIGNVTQIHGLGVGRKQVVCTQAWVQAQSMW